MSAGRHCLWPFDPRRDVVHVRVGLRKPSSSASSEAGSKVEPQPEHPSRRPTVPDLPATRGKAVVPVESPRIDGAPAPSRDVEGDEDDRPTVRLRAPVPSAS